MLVIQQDIARLDVAVNQTLLVGLRQAGERLFHDRQCLLDAQLFLSREQFRQRFAAADIIIAKGQANYETLSGAQAPLHFLLKAKCPVVARDIGCAVGDTLLFDSTSQPRGGTR